MCDRGDENCNAVGEWDHLCRELDAHAQSHPPGEYCCIDFRYDLVDSLLAELKRHLCKCGHWMREHGPLGSWDDSMSCHNPGCNPTPTWSDCENFQDE